MKKDILFLTGLFPTNKEKEILKNSKIQIPSAANAFQWNLIDGLEQNLGRPLKILNSINVGSFPFRYKKLILKSYKFNHCLNLIDHKDYNIGFVNLTGIKKILKLILLKFHIKKWALDKNENKIIIAYSLRSNTLKIFKYLKKLNPNIKTCIVIEDLPQYINTSNKKNIIYNVIRNLEFKSIYKFFDYSDSFVILTEYMKNKLPIKDKPYVVIEGIYTNKNNIIYKKNNDLKIILYTGTLNERYGVLNLVNAFKGINKKNYRLIFCGDGDSKNKILDFSKYDNRIILKGVLSREEILKLQSQATILINPRQNNNDFCKYSFPSKLLEYLSSGIPTIAYKLSGVPEEYDKYINYIEDNSEEALKNKILQVCEIDYLERKKIAEEAKDFVINNKNSKIQCKKILDMIN